MAFCVFRIFLSTLPARGATGTEVNAVINRIISIHAPREGSDLTRPRWALSRTYFYPRSPRGERLPDVQRAYRAHQISIHAPREGSDPLTGAITFMQRNFYPRSPRGERRFAVSIGNKDGDISIHAPREGSDSKNREENPCFCFIIQHSARIWKNCFHKKEKTGKIHAKRTCHTSAKGTGKRWVLHLRTGWQARVKRAGDRPAQSAGERRRVRPCFGSGCPADRSADCPERGR